MLIFKTEEAAEEYMKSNDKRIMVIYDDGIYDLTDFQHEHPGKKKCL